MAFVDQPIPPRSATQTQKEADPRGDDYGSTLTGDEHARAVAYAARVKEVSNNHLNQIVKPLASINKAAERSLRHKTAALMNSSPPYIEAP